MTSLQFLLYRQFHDLIRDITATTISNNYEQVIPEGLVWLGGHPTTQVSKKETLFYAYSL